MNQQRAVAPAVYTRGARRRERACLCLVRPPDFIGVNSASGRRLPDVPHYFFRADARKKNPSASHKPRAIHSATVKWPGMKGANFSKTSASEASAPNPAIARSFGRGSISQNERQVASQPNADAAEPTSVTGTRMASPSSRPAEVPAQIARTAVLGVRKRGCTRPKRSVTAPDRPSANSSRLEATKFPLKHWNSPKRAIVRIKLTGHLAPMACSKAIAVAKRLPRRLCHGVMYATEAMESA